MSLKFLELWHMKVATESLTCSSTHKAVFEEQSNASDTFGRASLPCDWRQLLHEPSRNTQLIYLFTEFLHVILSIKII